MNRRGFITGVLGVAVATPAIAVAKNLSMGAAFGPGSLVTEGVITEVRLVAGAISAESIASNAILTHKLSNFLVDGSQ